jgi:hypothetical protein
MTKKEKNVVFISGFPNVDFQYVNNLRGDLMRKVTSQNLHC